MPWGVAAAAVGSLASAAINSSAAGDNAAAAANAQSQELNATSPYSMNTGIGNTMFSTSGSGNQVTESALNPQYQGLRSGFLGNSAGFLNSLEGMGANGGMSPFLSNAYHQYQSSLPNPYGMGFNQLYGQAFGNNLGMAGNFQGAANGLLGDLGRFNPAASGQNYTNLLAQQTAPANALAAQNLTQNLFNSGALGSTGGANALGALGQMQGQQYVGQQLAGQQLGLQQSGLMGSLANQFGGNANYMNATNFGLGNNLNSSLYGRMYGAGQQGFQNALGLNQAGLQTMGAYGSLGQSMLGGGMGIDNAMLQQMLAGSQMGAMRTGAAVNGAQTNLQGQLAMNNTNAAGLNGLVSGLANANWAGLFSPSMSSSEAQPWGSGMMANNALSGAGFGGHG